MSGCGPEPAIVNAQATLQSDNWTETATYSCNTGFYMTGTPRITCNVSIGVWPASGLPSCYVIQENTIVTTNVYVPDLHDAWWFYLLAGLLALIAVVLLTWLLCWCCCGLCGCCDQRGRAIYPHTDHNGRPYRRSYGCCFDSRLSWGDCCCRKHGRERRQNTNSKGVYWVGNTNTQSKWEPGSPCMVCHSQNTLGSSGLSSTSSPHSARGPVRPKHHAHSHSCRGPPPGQTHNVAVGGATRDQTNGESSQVAEMYGGGGQGLVSVESPPPREAQLQRPVKPAKDPAKEAKIWMPHSNPIRQINTSTK